MKTWTKWETLELNLGWENENMDKMRNFRVESWWREWKHGQNEKLQSWILVEGMKTWTKWETSELNLGGENENMDKMRNFRVESWLREWKHGQNEKLQSWILVERMKTWTKWETSELNIGWGNENMDKMRNSRVESWLREWKLTKWETSELNLGGENENMDKMRNFRVESWLREWKHGQNEKLQTSATGTSVDMVHLWDISRQGLLGGHWWTGSTRGTSVDRVR